MPGILPGDDAGNGQVVVGIQAGGDAHERQLSGRTDVLRAQNTPQMQGS
jgi:hypothetical protein